MFTQKLCFILTFFFASTSFANKHILYSIEKDGKTSHILGTLHTVQEDLDKVHPLLPDLIQNARTAIFEVESVGVRLKGFHVFLDDFFRNNPTFDRSVGVSDEANERLTEFFDQTPEEYSYVKLWPMMPPGIVVLLVELLSLPSNSNLTQISVLSDQSLFIDRAIVEMFQAFQKPIISLDGEYRYQQAILENIDVAGLSHYILNELPQNRFQVLNENKTKFELVADGFKKALKSKLKEIDLINSYLIEDVEHVLSEFKDPFLERSRYYDALLFGRNAVWTPKILEELEKGGAMIVVGLAHLHVQREWGQSLLEIIEENGYKVTALPKADYVSLSSGALSCNSILL